MQRNATSGRRLCHVIACAVLGLGPPAMAQTGPDSADMAGCAGLLRALAQMEPTSEQAKRLRALSRVWAEAGVEAARKEGQFYPEFYVETLRLAAIDTSRQEVGSGPAEGLSLRARDCAEPPNLGVLDLALGGQD